MRREKLIFIYPKLFTFIDTEKRLLSEEYDLLCLDQPWTNKIYLPINFIRQFLFLVINIRRADTILISFAGYWSLLPSLFGNIFNKRTAIVVHGTDCVDFSEINYGNLRYPIMRWFIKRSLQLVDIILPVSESLVYTENTYYSSKMLRFGYSYHLEGIQTPYKVIPNGLLIEEWEGIDVPSKQEDTFISVMTNDQLIRKGADIIVEAAAKLPDCKFYLAGADSLSSIISNVPDNVILLGRLNPEDLKMWYNKTKFYLQLSNFEGFGVAICEAMLCHCIPIVSNVNYLPTIIGETGFVLNQRDSEKLFHLISSFRNNNLDDMGLLASERIKSKFHSGKRKEMLIQELKNR